MSANNKWAKVGFAPDARFAARPAPPAPFRATQETELERLKNRLLLTALNRLPEPGANPYVRRAANEAAALAWVTPYPLLVFPGLFEEKTGEAVRQARRQASVRERSRELMLAV